MATKAKSPAKKTAPAPINFNWFKASEREPAVKEIPSHNIFSISDVLLIITKDTTVPGYFIKYQYDHPGAATPRKKGDAIYLDMKGNELAEVSYFYPVDKIAVPADQAPKAE